jgi:hypothetical protein
MKFFHCTGYSKITGDESVHCERKVFNTTDYDFYKIFLDFSTDTAKYYIDEPEYERVLLSGTYPIIVDAHRDNIKKLYKLWKENYPCNILYTGPDVFFLNKVKFSDKFTKFSMFNYCRPDMKHRPEYGFPDYFNSDVRYFPSTMDEKLWELALEMEKNWPSYDTYLGSWDFEGHIWNKMLWSQGEGVDYFLKPQYDFEYVFRDLQSAVEFNKMPVNEAFLFHGQGSVIENLLPKLINIKNEGCFPDELWIPFFEKFENCF